MYIIFSEECLEYWAPMHVEAPERVYRTHKMLKEEGFRFLKPEPCSKEDLLLVHSKDLVERIKLGKYLDADTPNLPGMYDYARLSAGGAVKSMEEALKGNVSFSLMRPPGHHTGINGSALGASTQGFCYFNNVAVACRKALTHVEKVAIIDVDCHHGNGTQEIFLGDPAVLFVSLHRCGLVYPGTGESSEQNCLNYPFTHQAGDAEYLDTLKQALKRVVTFDPDLVAVSAGFDANRFDPMQMFALSEDAYVQIGGMISELGRPTFCVLEGGYGPKMPECVCNFLVGLDKT